MRPLPPFEKMTFAQLREIGKAAAAVVDALEKGDKERDEGAAERLRIRIEGLRECLNGVEDMDALVANRDEWRETAQKWSDEYKRLQEQLAGHKT